MFIHPETDLRLLQAQWRWSIKQHCRVSGIGNTFYFVFFVCVFNTAYVFCLLCLCLCLQHSLCGRKSNRVKGDPFRPVSAIPIDMFPQTPHCELVIVLEREPMEEGKDIEEEEEDKDDDDSRPTDKAHICGTSVHYVNN